MSIFLWSAFIVAAIAAIFLSSINSSNLRNYFKKNYPKEWEEYMKSKPRFYIPAKSEGTWNNNDGAMSEFIKKTPVLSRDLRLKKLAERMRATRIVVACGAIIFFVLLILSRLG